jgi:hypothetical protein
MFNGKFISIREIVYRVKRNALMADANFSDMVLDVLDLIRSIGAPMAYESNIKYLNVVDYRAELPDNLFYIESVEKVEPTGCFPMQYAISNSGGKWNCVSAAGCSIKSNLTYSIKRNYIYTDFETGTIALHFKQLSMDDGGYPLIPDDISLIRAVENYVKMKHYQEKWEMSEIPYAVFQKVEQDYLWYIAQAENSLKMPSVDEMETIKNALVRIIPNFRAHDESFDYEHLSRVK